MTVIKDKHNEDGSYSIFIGSKEIFRGSQEEAEEAAKKTGATLGLGTGAGVGWAIGSLAATTPVFYLLLPIYMAFCVLVAKKLEED